MGEVLLEDQPKFAGVDRNPSPSVIGQAISRRDPFSGDPLPGEATRSAASASNRFVSEQRRS
jgi:hypothetical protein